MKWMSQKHVDLGSGSVGRLLLSLAAPTITSQIVNMLYNPVSYTHLDVYKRQASALRIPSSQLPFL